MKQTTHRKPSNGGHDQKIMPFALLTRGAAAASVAGLVFAASPAHEALGAAPDFVPKLRQGNPLMIPVGANWWAKPALVDIDGDGDQDIFIGDAEGTIAYFENIGTSSSPNFALAVGSDNPFWYESGCDTYYPYYIEFCPSPTFVDIDGDGDMDAFVGESNGDIHFFENTGTATAPDFTWYDPSDAENPFEGIRMDGYYATITFADLDGDGDMDAVGGEGFAGSGEGSLHYFKNTGTSSAPAFEHYYPGDTANPFYDIDLGWFTAPVLVDIDGDGDMDAFVGESEGNVNFLENVGTPYAPVFELQEVVDEPVARYLNPSSSLNTKYHSLPAFADIDGDGDMDAFVGDYFGTVTVFENTGDATDPAFTEMLGTASPTFGFDAEKYSAPAFVDIDGDGDMDAFIGNLFGEILFAENSGTATAPLFAALFGGEDTANPFMGVDTGYDAKPAFVDIDGDGDTDAFAGDGYGNLLFFENMGSESSPAFVQRFEGDNPLDGTMDDGEAAPVFADIDGDGDMDAFVGESNGDINFLENTGTATAPAFASSVTNPFGLVNVGAYAYSTPAFADIDGDGDLDAVVGTWYYGLRYFENTGTETAPAFTELDGTNNPFAAFFEQTWLYAATPTFVDIDGDGDMDLFAGEKYGKVVYFENRLITTPPPVDDDDDDDDDDDGVIIPPADDDDTCFIDSVSSEAGQENWLAGAVKHAYAAVRSLLRY